MTSELVTNFTIWYEKLMTNLSRMLPEGLNFQSESADITLISLFFDNLTGI